MFGALSLDFSKLVDIGGPKAAIQEALSAAPAQAAAPQQAAPAQPAPAGVDPADWKALKKREDELAARERALAALEKGIDAKLAELKTVEARLKAMLEEANVLKDAKVKQLVDVYTNMKAKQAAAVLESLEEKLAVKILSGMRGRQAGEILSFVETKKAARLSEALTRLQMVTPDQQ